MSFIPSRRSGGGKQEGGGKKLRRKPKSPDSFFSGASPADMAFGEQRPPPLPAVPDRPFLASSALKPPQPPPSTTTTTAPPPPPPSKVPPLLASASKGFGYFDFASSATGNSSSKKQPPTRPPRPPLSKSLSAPPRDSDEWTGGGGSSSSSARPPSTLPTPFTAFPTPRSSMAASSATTRSPVPPLLEISDFGGFDWGLDDIGTDVVESSSSKSKGASLSLGLARKNSRKASPASSSLRQQPSPLLQPTSARAPAPKRPPPPLPSSSSSSFSPAPLLTRVRSTRRGPPAPIRIFSPLLRSPPKIDISPSGDPNEREQMRVSEIGGRRRSATLQPSSALSTGSDSSEAGVSYDTHDGSGGSSAGLGLEEAVVSRGKLVSMYEVTRGSTLPVAQIRKPSTSMEEVRSPPLLRTPGSNHLDHHPPTPSPLQSPSSVYSNDSAPGLGRIGASLIQLTLTHPSTPSSHSSHASTGEGSSTKSTRPRLSQLIVPPPSTHLSTLSQSPASATHTSPSSSYLRPNSVLDASSPVVVTQSPEQLRSGESSNFTGRSNQSNQFQFSPAQKSLTTLTPLTDPSSTSSRNGTPNTSLSHFASTASLSPALPRSYTPGSGPSTSVFAASPGLVNALNTPGTGASSSSSGKFSHPPRPSALASLAASTAGLPRSRSESTPFVEGMGSRMEPKRLSKSRWASDSDLRSTAYYIAEEPTTGRVEEDPSIVLTAPRMPAAMEEQGRAASPALSTKSSFLELPLNSPAPSRTFPSAPRPTPASSFKAEYAPSTVSNGSSGSIPSSNQTSSSGPSPPPLQHSHSTPMLPTAASIASKANLPPSINLPLPEDPPLPFQTIAVPFKTVPLAEARSLFSTSEVQQIISLSIQSASPVGSVHLLSVEAMSVLVPLEIRKLQARQQALITEFKAQSRRRKRIHGYLNEQRGGTSEGKAGRIASALTGITSKGDAACEELYIVTHQIDQLKTVLAESVAGGLSLALGKINASFLRSAEKMEAEKAEKAHVQEELAALRAQLDSERSKTLEAEEEKSKLAKELETAKEALLFIEPRTPRPTSSVASHFQYSSEPPLSPESEPGHISSPDPASPQTSSPASPSSTADDHESSSRWSVDLGAASFFPFPPQRLPDSPAPGSIQYPTSPLSFPLSPALPSTSTPRFALATQASFPPPPLANTTFLSPPPILPTPPLALRPRLDDQTPTQLNYLQGAQNSPSDSISTIRPTKGGHSHGSSSISMMVLDSPTHPSSTSTFAVVPSYPYSSTYTTNPLQTSGSRYRRNGIHFRTNSEAGGLSAAALLPPRRLQGDDWVDESEEEVPISISISPLKTKPSVKREREDQGWKTTTTDELSFTKRKMVRAHTEKGSEGAKEKFKNRGKRSEGRKSAMEMETTESIMLALATTSLWSTLNGEAVPQA